MKQKEINTGTEMNKEEMGQIARKILGYLKNQKSLESRESWQKLNANEVKQKMGKIREATNISLDRLEVFYKYFLPEIFGKSFELMSEAELGEISLKIWNYMADTEKIQIPPQNQKRRELGRIAKATGIDIETLKRFYRKWLTGSSEEIRGKIGEIFS